MSAREKKPVITRGGHIATGTSAERRKKTAKNGTQKSASTRRSLLDAARAVFVDVGYFDTRVSDIVAEANIAHGSFYTYFPSKREAFQAVCDEVTDLITQAVQHSDEDVPGDTYGNLERANRRYLRIHAQHSRILDLVEQVATADPDVHRTGLATRAMHVQRVERLITTMQTRGQADNSLHAPATAGALVSMLASYAHWSSLDPNYDEDRVTEALTRIWAQAIGLQVETDG